MWLRRLGTARSLRLWLLVMACSSGAPGPMAGAPREAVAGGPEAVNKESRRVFKSRRAAESRSEMEGLMESRGVVVVGSLVVVMKATSEGMEKAEDGGGQMR